MITRQKIQEERREILEEFRQTVYTINRIKLALDEDLSKPRDSVSPVRAPKFELPWAAEWPSHERLTILRAKLRILDRQELRILLDK